MPRLGCSGKIIIAALVLVALLGVGSFLFPVPQPHIALPADEVFHIGGFPITNTLLASWLIIAVLAGLFYAGTRRMKLIPKGLQNAVELVIEMLANFCDEVAGKEHGRRFFPIVATIFLYVIMAAFLSLLPGFDTIGKGAPGTWDGAFFGHGSGFMVTTPLLRKANTDINFPLMLALVSFVCVGFWGITSVGLRRYMSRFIRIGGLLSSIGQLVRGKFRPALGGLVTGVIDIFIGFIEMVSEFVRIISFTFRLFGNMTAGMVRLLMVCFLVPWIVAIPFYGLEMLLGFVQALIFAGLTLVFATIAVAPPEVRQGESL